ncbi:MAG: hypothetical protein R3B12_02925 [Candidatus Saccharimonadales bacterium]
MRIVLMLLKTTPTFAMYRYFKTMARMQVQHCNIAIAKCLAFHLLPEKVLTEVKPCHYKQKHGNCAVMRCYSGVELTDNVRVAYELDHAIALCPFASEYPYELLIIPKKTYYSSLSKLR